MKLSALDAERLSRLTRLDKQRLCNRSKIRGETALSTSESLVMEDLKIMCIISVSSAGGVLWTMI